MKTFLKYTLGAFIGCGLAMFFLTFFGIGVLVGIATASSTGKEVEKHSILKIAFAGELKERGEENPLYGLLGDSYNALSLNQILKSIETAKTLDEIDGIYLEGAVLSGATPAMLQEIRAALVDFKKSGKFIYAYADSYSQGSYYVCSVADSVLLNPQGGIEWCGMASQPMFFKDLLEKFGVKMQVFKVGTYKAAVEPFITDKMSDANREQVTSYLNSIWGQILKETATSRKLSVDSLNAYADSYTYFEEPAVLKKKGMVDALVYMDQVKEILKRATGRKEKEELNLVTPEDIEALPENTKKALETPNIAVYYAFGDLMQSAVSNTQDCIAADQVIKDLAELRDNNDIKAVVLRVNSGGGSAYAGEMIWREVKRLREKKPVVVSMGGMAASGGYYISCAANRIFAEPTTLTGSIGIFGMFPDASELLTDKLGVKFDVVKTNSLADFGTSSRPFNDTERALLQRYINRGYDTFIKRVSDGRKMADAKVREIAEGRVWTGEQALKLGLVDQLGGLKEAIAYAAKLGKVDKVQSKEYPEDSQWFLKLLEEKKADYLESEVRSYLGEYYTTFRYLKSLNSQDAVQARIPYVMDIIH
jgi:protease-4